VYGRKAVLTRCLSNREHIPVQYPLISINFFHIPKLFQQHAGTCSALAVYHMVSCSSAYVCHGFENHLSLFLLLSHEKPISHCCAASFNQGLSPSPINLFLLNLCHFDYRYIEGYGTSCKNPGTSVADPDPFFRSFLTRILPVNFGQLQ
jgi:hypothetical protein